MDNRHSGGCLCGGVRFETRGTLRAVTYCHCEQCRRQTGHYLAATACADAELAIRGEENLTWYAASELARRGFCKVCGSLLFWKAHGRSSTSIMAGSFDRPSGLHGGRHIYLAEKGDYYDIDDGLPQADRV